jgi:hypothetical protein
MITYPVCRSDFDLRNGMQFCRSHLFLTQFKTRHSKMALKNYFAALFQEVGAETALLVPDNAAAFCSSRRQPNLQSLKELTSSFSQLTPISPTCSPSLESSPSGHDSDSSILLCTDSSKASLDMDSTILLSPGPDSYDHKTDLNTSSRPRALE